MARPDDDLLGTDFPGFGYDKAAAFSTTHWSVVLTAGQDNPEGAAAALEQLCRKYWYPMYAFIRRRGSGPHEAEDLTQGFFAHLLEMETLKKADQRKGKFRTFLLLDSPPAHSWNIARRWIMPPLAQTGCNW